MSSLDQPSTRGALLLGSDHTELGGYSVADVDTSLAIAMSPGARPKQTRSSDPNEDAGAVARSNGAALLVVADAHFGREASEIAVDHVLGAFGNDPPDASLSEDQLVTLFFAAGVAIQRETTRPGCVHPETRTTLALALVAGDALQWAAIGDSCVVVVGPEGGARVDTPRAVYLGDRFTHADIAGGLTRGRAAWNDVTCVVCATDGLSDGLSREGRGLARVVADESQAAESARELAVRLVTHVVRRGLDDAVTVAVALN